MKKIVFCALPMLLAGCADSLENLSNEVYNSQIREPRKGFEETIEPTVRAYYLQKYGADADQRLQAMKAGERLLKSAAASRRNARYVAVDVPKSSQSKGDSQVMLFDTQSASVVGNEVYDLRKAPDLTTKLLFDTYSAEYVGTGEAL